MSNNNSYTEYFLFQQKINELESILIDKLNKYIQYVGISIQLYEELQDNFSPTREHTTAINCYCSNVQRMEKFKCNLFDIDAKKYYRLKLLEKIDFNSDEKLSSLLCSCHADVTNLLFLFNPKETQKYKDYSFNNKYENNEINLYIFIGHFLLNEYPFTDIISDNLFLYHNSDGYDYKLINEFEPKINNDINKKKYLVDTDNCDFNIQFSTYENLKNVKLIIQEELTMFLLENEYLNLDSNKKTITVNKKLNTINDLPSITKITNLLIEVSERINKYSSISFERKQEFNKIQRTISNKIKKTKALLYEIKGKSNFNEFDNKFENNNLFEIYKWLKRGLEKNAGLKKWLKEFKQYE